MPGAIRARDALVAAVIGDPQPPMPPPAEVELQGFWDSFAVHAPLHLRAGLRVAVLMLAVVLPRLMGHVHGLARLSPEDRDAVLQRAASLPLLADLTEIAKLVACFAYFSDPGVQDAARGRT